MQEVVDLRNDVILDEMSRRGAVLYEERLKTVLEPEYNGQVAAVHLDSGEYEVALTSGVALHKLRGRFPNGIAMVMDIGPVADDDPLTLRMLGKQLISGHSK